MSEPATMYSIARCGFDKAQISRNASSADDAVTSAKNSAGRLLLVLTLSF